MLMQMQFQSTRIDSDQRAKALTLVHAGRGTGRHRRNLPRRPPVEVVAATAAPSD